MMPLPQSSSTERACDRCRERRVKCDKRQPACFRCEKLGKDCPGYEKKRKFVDEGATLRRKYQTKADEATSIGQMTANHDNIDLQRAEKTSPTPRPVGFAARNELSALDKAAQVRTHAHTPSVSDVCKAEIVQPYSTPNLDDTDPVYARDHVSLLDPADAFILEGVWDSQTLNPQWFNIDPEEYYNTEQNSCGFIVDVPIIVDEIDKPATAPPGETTSAAATSPSELSTTLASRSELNTSNIITDERDHEMAYLIRHFTEALGPWLDLFDHNRHFGGLVPLKALRDALLRNAIAAVSAKQLGRLNGVKMFTAHQRQRSATMETIDEAEAVDWFYKAANYYDKAIAYSRIYIQAIASQMTAPLSPDATFNTSPTNTDDLLVAVSIFSLYESLDNLEIGWLQHLAGLKTLLSAVNTMPKVSPSITVARRASFWNFARADYQASYLNRQHTFLKTDDYNLWRGYGLTIQDHGSLYADTAWTKNSSRCREDTEIVAHTLLWLVLKVMNYLATVCTEAATVRQAVWLRLTEQLNEWHANLPPTFEPCARIRHTTLAIRSPGGPERQLYEVFFSMDVCAAALQLYHFARILLILNKPMQMEDLGAGSGMLKAYRAMSAEATRHSHRIIGIALGRPHPAVRVEMLLPLYVAGSCLEADDERQVVLELLTAIEKDTGCSTGKRCDDLRQEWGWAKDLRGVPVC